VRLRWLALIGLPCRCCSYPCRRRAVSSGSQSRVAKIMNSAPCGWARKGRAFERAGLCEKKHGDPPPCFTARNSRFLQLYYSCVCAQRARLALTTR
jgi:hypothetical protein